MKDIEQVEVAGAIQSFFPDTLIVKIELDENDLDRILTTIERAAEILAEAITDLGKEIGQ